MTDAIGAQYIGPFWFCIQKMLNTVTIKALSVRVLLHARNESSSGITRMLTFGTLVSAIQLLQQSFSAPRPHPPTCDRRL